MADELKVIVSADASRLTTEMTKATASLQKFEKGSAQATNAMTNLGRVVQDAPFGFTGIANNLNPLLESFQRLKAETGSVGGAFKSLGASILGGGGIGFALSAITAVIAFATNGFSAWTRGLTSATEAIKKKKDALDASIGSLVNEKTQVDVIVEKLRSETLTREQRVAAIQKLQSIAPAYFRTLNEEKATVDQITAAYDNFNASLLRRIRAASANDKLIDIQKRIFELEIKGSQLSDEQVDNSGKIQKAQNAILVPLGQELSLREQYQAFQRGTLLLTKDENKELDNLYNTRKRLIELVAKNQGNESLFIDAKKARVEIDELDKVVRKVKPIEYEVKLKEPFSIPSLDLGKPPTSEIERFVRDFSDLFNQFIQESAVGIGVAFGQTLGQALAGTASLGDFFKNIFAVVGQGLQQLGSSLLAASIAIKGIKEFLVKNPVAAIAGSIALIAIGSLIKAATTKNAFATGTNFAPGGLSLVGERGPELINLPRGSRVTPAAQTAASLSGGLNDIRVYGVMRGRDIYFTNQRYGQTFNTTT